MFEIKVGVVAGTSPYPGFVRYKYSTMQKVSEIGTVISNLISQSQIADRKIVRPLLVSSARPVVRFTMMAEPVESNPHVRLHSLQRVPLLQAQHPTPTFSAPLHPLSKETRHGGTPPAERC